MIMQKAEYASGCLMMITFVCAASKQVIAQNACKYARMDKRTRRCMWLGNWTQGQQICDCKAAREGLLNLAKQGGKE